MHTRFAIRAAVAACLLMLSMESAISESKTDLGLFATNLRAGELLIKFRGQTALSAADTTLQKIGAQTLHRFSSSGALHIRVPSALTPWKLKQVADWLTSTRLFDYVEPNAELHAFAVLPNDSDFNRLYALHNTGDMDGSIADADIDAPEAWEKTTGSQRIRVAVIDSGIDYNHPDLIANIWRNPGETGVDNQGNDKATNGIDDDRNGLVDDWHGWNFFANNNNPFDDNSHGTHCAGTIGASGNNGIGVAGVNWKVSLVPIKFLDKSGAGATSDAVKAIEYATKLDVDIMSNSWGGGPFSETLETAIKAANEKGILFVAAAGNDTRNNDKASTFPASYAVENILAVAATDNRDKLANFSSYGKASVHLAAPGVNILSTIPNGGYELLSGTSMATPLVAGAAALVKSLHPGLKAANLKRRLLASVDHFEKLGEVTSSGGRLNVASAMEDDSTPPSKPADLKVTKEGLTSTSLTWSASGDDYDVGRATAYEIRMSSNPIRNETEWNSAVKMSFISGLATSQETLSMDLFDLKPGTSGYFAVRAFDNVANASPISDSVPYTTKTPITIYENDAETLDTLTTTGPFAVQTLPEKGSVFSDSPKGDYATNANTTLTFPPLQIAGNDLLVSLWTRYDIEQSYDYGTVEASVDGGKNWKVVQSFSGISNGKNVIFPLVRQLPANTESLLLRLRFRSDGSEVKDGWYVDDFTVSAPSPQE